MEKLVGNESVHVVCGGPPCGGFSVAGLRNPRDERNQLFKEFARLVEKINPLFVVMENVPGVVTTLQKGQVYRELIRRIRDNSAILRMSVRVLEAAAYGVPQLRARAIFVANRVGVKNAYPAEQLSRENYIPIESAIDDLKDLPPDPSFNHEWTRHSRKMEARLANVPPGGSVVRNLPGRLETTIQRGAFDGSQRKTTAAYIIHYEKNRVLSARELARLQTFPDDLYPSQGLSKSGLLANWKRRPLLIGEKHCFGTAPFTGRVPCAGARPQESDLS